MPENCYDFQNEGERLYGWAKFLFPICRSLTGPGVRETFRYLKNLIPELQVHEVPTGTQAFDWTVPQEWEIREAYIEDESGTRIVDFSHHNLLVVGYSEPVDKVLNLEDLEPHLHSIPEMPEAIPYVTSYYRQTWGFCLTQTVRNTFKPGNYRVRIDSTLKDGFLTYGDVVIRGKTDKEILFSSYICHPSMGNDQVSGPVALAGLVRWIKAQKHLYHTIRIVFIPETIGSLVYLSRHLEEMKQKTVAGLVVACVGDNRTYSMMESRYGNTVADRAIHNILRHKLLTYKTYDYLWPNRGSDERNYCMPGIDLPVASFFRSKYGTYPEYHTSLDNLDLICPEGFAGTLEVLTHFIELIEHNKIYLTSTLGEPQLGRRNLYPTGLGHRTGYGDWISNLMNILAYCDGTNDLFDLADRLKVLALDLIPLIKKLEVAGLITSVHRRLTRKEAGNDYSPDPAL